MNDLVLMLLDPGCLTQLFVEPGSLPLALKVRLIHMWERDDGDDGLRLYKALSLCHNSNSLSPRSSGRLSELGSTMPLCEQSECRCLCCVRNSFYVESD